MKRIELQKKNIKELGVLLIAILIVCFISSIFFFRLDLTAEKKYTLTKITKNLVENLDSNLQITIYIEGDKLPIGLKKLRNSTKEFLDELKNVSNGKIVFQFINPSESEDKATRFKLYTELQDIGLQPIEIKEKNEKGSSSQSYIFPGAIIRYKDQAIAVNLLKNNQMLNANLNLNNSEQTLEYEFSNAILKLTSKETRQIAFTEGHGELKEVYVHDIEKTLSEYYTVRRGAIDGKLGSLDSFSVVIIAKPTVVFNEKDKFVLDQYLMKGGKIIWLVDGAIVDLDSLNKVNSIVSIGNNLNIDDQLFRYGARLNQDLVTDYICSPIGVNQANQNGQASIQFFPWYYSPLILTDNKHPINRFISVVKTNFVSSIDTLDNNTDLKKTVLLKTSNQSKKIQLPAVISLLDLNRQKKEDFTHTPLNIATLIEGTFESNYKNRNIANLTDEKYNLITKSKKTSIIVIGDGDFIKNDIQTSGEAYPLGYDKKTKKNYAGNKEFFLNCLNYLCDDKGLMDLRLREIRLRILDKKIINEESGLIKSLNFFVPILLVIILGLSYHFRRLRKFK